MLTGRNQNWICKAFLRLAELTTQKKKDSLILTEDLFILTKSHKINRDKTKNKRNQMQDAVDSLGHAYANARI